MPVIHHYQNLKLVAEVNLFISAMRSLIYCSQINASPTVDEVYVETRKVVDKVLYH